METRVRIKSNVCNHWWDATVPGMGVLSIPYVRALRTVACPKCNTLASVRELFSGIRREIFARSVAVAEIYTEVDEVAAVEAIGSQSRRSVAVAEIYTEVDEKKALEAIGSQSRLIDVGARAPAVGAGSYQSPSVPDVRVVGARAPAVGAGGFIGTGRQDGDQIGKGGAACCRSKSVRT